MWQITACLLRNFWITKLCSFTIASAVLHMDNTSNSSDANTLFRRKKPNLVLISPENIEIPTTIPSSGFNHLERTPGTPQRMQLVCKWGRPNHFRLAAPLHFVSTQLYRVPTSCRQLWDGSYVYPSVLVQWLFWINEIDQKWNGFQSGLLFLYFYLLIQ